MRKYFLYLVPLFTLATLIVNGLSGTGRINDLTPQVLSDSYPVLFVPAGYVFSIWGVIYIGLIAYSIYQSRHNEKSIEGTRELFIISCLANISWIFLWHYRHPLWSVLAMLVLLISLISIYRKLGIGVKKVATIEYWMVHIPFSIYLGWISVATIANITVALYILKFEILGISPETWSALLIIIAATLGTIMVIRRKDLAFAGVIIWALLGVGVKFQSIGIISFTSFLAILIMTGVIVFNLLKKHEDKLLINEEPDAN